MQMARMRLVLALSCTAATAVATRMGDDSNVDCSARMKHRVGMVVSCRIPVLFKVPCIDTACDIIVHLVTS
jgi:hypothetical protein